MPTSLLDKPLPVPFRPSPGETHQTITLGTVAYSPYLPPGATCILVQAVTQNIRYTMNGTTPTATVGFQLVAADPPTRIDIYEHMVLQFFREAAGAILQYEVGE